MVLLISENSPISLWDFWVTVLWALIGPHPFASCLEIVRLCTVAWIPLMSCCSYGFICSSSYFSSQDSTSLLPGNSSRISEGFLIHSGRGQVVRFPFNGTVLQLVVPDLLTSLAFFLGPSEPPWASLHHIFVHFSFSLLPC